MNTARSLKQIFEIIENEINALEADLKGDRGGHPQSSFKTEYRESELAEYQRLKALMIDFKKGYDFRDNLRLPF